jgi:hypothetical protein
MSEETAGKIEIIIEPNDLSWNSNLSEAELVFWLETVKAMVLKGLIERTNEAD